MSDWIDKRVKEYVDALPGTLLDRNASEAELISSADIFRDGIKEGIEHAEDQLLKLCRLLPTHIDLDNLDPVEFKDNSHRLIPAIQMAQQILERQNAKF